MTRMDPYAKPLVEWDERTNSERVFNAMAYLYLNGFLTDSEKEKIRKRINAWVAKSQADKRSKS
jgi:hypothetical protein